MSWWSYASDKTRQEESGHKSLPQLCPGRLPLKAVYFYLKKKKNVGFYLASGMPDTQRKIPELWNTDLVSNCMVGSRKGGAGEMSTFQSHWDVVRSSYIWLQKRLRDYIKQLKSDLRDDSFLSYYRRGKMWGEDSWNEESRKRRKTNPALSKGRWKTKSVRKEMPPTPASRGIRGYFRSAIYFPVPSTRRIQPLGSRWEVQQEPHQPPWGSSA